MFEELKMKMEWVSGWMEESVMKGQRNWGLSVSK
jgi:hypothetical protein